MVFIFFLTSEPRFANTVIAIDAIFADAIITRIAGTVIKVNLTIGTCVGKEDLEFEIRLFELFQIFKQQ